MRPLRIVARINITQPTLAAKDGFEPQILRSFEPQIFTDKHRSEKGKQKTLSPCLVFCLICVICENLLLKTSAAQTSALKTATATE